MALLNFMLSRHTFLKEAGKGMSVHRGFLRLAQLEQVNSKRENIACALFCTAVL
jgi:hypothetical protein